MGIASTRTDLAFEVVDLRDYPDAVLRRAALRRARDPPEERGGAPLGEKGRGARRLHLRDRRSRPQERVSGRPQERARLAYTEFNRKPATFVAYGSAGGARAVEQLRLVLAELQVASLKFAVHVGYAELVGMLREGKTFADYPYLEPAAVKSLRQSGLVDDDAPRRAHLRQRLVLPAEWVPHGGIPRASWVSVRASWAPPTWLIRTSMDALGYAHACLWVHPCMPLGTPMHPLGYAHACPWVHPCMPLGTPMHPLGYAHACPWVHPCMPLGAPMHALGYAHACPWAHPWKHLRHAPRLTGTPMTAHQSTHEPSSMANRPATLAIRRSMAALIAS